MKILKNKDKKLDIKVPPNSRIPIDTPDMCFSAHTILTAVGKRQSGKSVFITNYLRLLREGGACDRIFVISPTIDSNKALLDSLGIDEQDCFDPDDPQTIEKLKDQIDEERDDWENYEHKLERYKELRKVLINDKIPIEQIDPYLFLDLCDNFGNIVEPQSKYGHFPVLHCFVDDCQSSKLFRDKRFLNLCIRHRHMGGLKKGGALGISLYIAVQNIKAQAGGLPRAIKNNTCQMIVVGKSKDSKELKDIYESMAGELDEKQFMQAYDYVNKDDPHGCLVLDLHPKKNHPSKYRKGMSEFIIF